jgi:hypothetical protein
MTAPQRTAGGGFMKEEQDSGRSFEIDENRTT